MKKIKYHIEIIKTSRYCYINAISDNNERIGKVCIDLESEDSNRYKNICIGNNIAKIILVQTNESICGNGIATALLNKVIETFNNYNLYLNVVPLIRSNKDKSKNELINFYSKFGFIRYNKDICVTTMIRV